jgi:hypothetical protein
MVKKCKKKPRASVGQFLLTLKAEGKDKP